MVPISAITKVGNRSVVLVPNAVASTTASSTKVRNSITPVQTAVHAVSVTVGISNDTSTEIIDSLTEGQTIVTRTVTAGTAGAATTARTGSIFGLGGGGGGATRVAGGGS